MIQMRTAPSHVVITGSQVERNVQPNRRSTDVAVDTIENAVVSQVKRRYGKIGLHILPLVQSGVIGYAVLIQPVQIHLEHYGIVGNDLSVVIDQIALVVDSAVRRRSRKLPDGFFPVVSRHKYSRCFCDTVFSCIRIPLFIQLDPFPECLVCRRVADGDKHARHWGNRAVLELNRLQSVLAIETHDLARIDDNRGSRWQREFRSFSKRINRHRTGRVAQHLCLMQRILATTDHGDITVHRRTLRRSIRRFPDTAPLPGAPASWVWLRWRL